MYLVKGRHASEVDESEKKKNPKYSFVGDTLPICFFFFFKNTLSLTPLRKLLVIEG